MYSSTHHRSCRILLRLIARGYGSQGLNAVYGRVCEVGLEWRIPVFALEEIHSSPFLQCLQKWHVK